MVTNLLLKPTKGAPLSSVDRLRFSTAGIVNNVPCSPLRQVLILPQSTLNEFRLKPGDLRENLVVDCDELHALESGTVLQVGVARIRLTFHCEPCGRVVDKARASSLLHKRGYLGQFLNAGELALSDSVAALGVQYEAVPYRAKDRIQWFLSRQTQPILLTEMLFQCGLPVGYARAVPGFLKSMPDSFGSRVIIKSRQTYPAQPHSRT